MEIKNKVNIKNDVKGFALLITLIVVGVVLSVGLTILDLSIKQIQLSFISSESEKAFHAANAGAECARYWRGVASSSMVIGQTISPTCFEVVPDTNTVNEITTGVTGDGEVYQYEYEFTWGVEPRCTQINTLIASSTALGTGVTTSNMTTLIPGYSGNDDYYCDSGSQCTTISVRGYNQSCGTIGGYGIVQREVLLQF